MPQISIHVLWKGKLVQTVQASSKYDAKQRKARMQMAYPDCEIIIGDLIGDINGTKEVQRTSDVESSDI